MPLHTQQFQLYYLIKIGGMVRLNYKKRPENLAY